jgi:hypothetical protein
MVEGMLDIFWKNNEEVRDTPRFQLHFVKIDGVSHGPLKDKKIAGEDMLEAYLIEVGFEAKKAKEWLKKVKEEKSVSIRPIMMPEKYAFEYQ